MIKSLIKKVLGRLGFAITRNREASYYSPDASGSMSAALGRIKKLGIAPGCIIDVGAASGNWTKEVHALWPEANIVAFEPLKEQVERFLQTTSGFSGQVTLHQAVAGEKRGEISFSVTDDPDGSGVYEDGKGISRKLNMLPIDEAVDGQAGRFLLKLDTHGFELPILKGAEAVLNKTDVCIIEVYGFYVSPTAPLFHELSAYLFAKGFRLFDIVDVMRRKGDQAFWQADAVFLRANHPVFTNNNYR